MNNDKVVPPTPHRKKLHATWKEGTAFLVRPGRASRVPKPDPKSSDTSFLPARRELPRPNAR
jgi:hypothetical protein